MALLNQTNSASFPEPHQGKRSFIEAPPVKWALVILFSITLSTLWIWGINRTLAQPFTLLLLGSDRREEGAPCRSDSIFLLRIDPRANTVRGLALPRDLYVSIQGLPVYRTGKINSALFYGSYYNADGIKAAEETVGAVTGVPIDGTLVVHLRFIEHLINSIGGLEIYFESPVCDNTTSDLDDTPAPERFEAGWNYLDGKRAIRYLRIRRPDTDFGRIRRNQQFTAAVAQKLRSPAAIVGALRAIPYAAWGLDTDIRPTKALRLICKIPSLKNIEWSSISREDITPQTLPTGSQILVAEPTALKEAGLKLLGAPDHFASATPVATPHAPSAQR